MITIPLMGNRPLSHRFSYSISPLYELAASLHTLAQPTPPEHFSPWIHEKLSHFQVVRLMKDWEYFLPLFRFAIPDSFDPYQTKGVMAVNDQYEYFVTLTTPHFLKSLTKALDAWNAHHDQPEVADDLREDPEYVKGRFSLFISSYWQLSFESNWEEIAPEFVKEAERIHHSLEDHASLSDLLQGILPAIQLDAEQLTLACPHKGQTHEAQKLILYPSYYYAGEPLVTVKDADVHLLYSFTTPSAPTKNAL
ncbi:hypothetical protein [Brevibacillus choshinensis]|uniref:Uncharacterized protein n=1 Tax=Brevibacillus choshinensis TaxID=54911 RepID=A0ABX7FGQ2_BRECH|nr:hypothetical protein [Brevibacillus choshinensis]QRG65371.1 hypothetical protein JNE38_17235 [Brevibacillus choshinensis]